MALPALIPSIDVNAGQSNVMLVGDKAVALTAQVNRFLKHDGYPEQPLQPGVITLATGLTALGILNARLTASLINEKDSAARVGISTEMHNISAAQSDPVAYVQSHLEQVTRTLAIWGDIQGYPPASVGITTRDPRIRRWYQTWWGMGLLGAGVLGVLGAIGKVAVDRARQ